MKKVEIKNRWDGSVLWSCEVEDDDCWPTRTALRLAVSKGAYLKGAYLKGAYLKGANLEGANLEGANLKGAYLKGAYLEGAYLEGAYLEGADLEGAYLEGANLEGANLEGADLEGANLKGAYLKGAYLDPIRDDIWAVLESAPQEAEGVLAALHEGRVDGSTYSGECACLVGTVCNSRGLDFFRDARLLADAGITGNSSRPAERWFLAIRKGDTPASNPVAALSAQWVEEWLIAQTGGEWDIDGAMARGETA